MAVTRPWPNSSDGTQSANRSERILELYGGGPLVTSDAPTSCCTIGSRTTARGHPMHTRLRFLLLLALSLLAPLGTLPAQQAAASNAAGPRLDVTAVAMQQTESESS